MKKIGNLSVGKNGFDIGFENDFKRDLHGNYDLFVDIQNTSHNSDYTQCQFCHGTKRLCRDAAKCDHDGRDCDKNNNCGEYVESVCKHCV